MALLWPHTAESAPWLAAAREGLLELMHAVAGNVELLMQPTSDAWDGSWCAPPGKLGVAAAPTALGAIARVLPCMQFSPTAHRGLVCQLLAAVYSCASPCDTGDRYQQEQPAPEGLQLQSTPHLTALHPLHVLHIMALLPGPTLLHPSSLALLGSLSQGSLTSATEGGAEGGAKGEAKGGAEGKVEGGWAHVLEVATALLGPTVQLVPGSKGE